MPTLKYNLQPISLPNRAYSTLSYATTSRNSFVNTINPCSEFTNTNQNSISINANISDTPNVNKRYNEELREQEHSDNSISGVSQGIN